MKKVYSVFIALILSLTVSSQSCLPEGILFSTQAQIDSFQVNYPNCTEIEGDVHIVGSDITSLAGLQGLTSIGGYLNIESNDALASLAGLEGLTSIGDYFFIEYNDALTSLAGLEGLTSIAGNISIKYNDGLTSLSGLEGLTYLGGYLWINDNQGLTSVTGLEALTSCGGGLSIINDDSLIDLTGLEVLTSINAELYISDNASLTNLTGLDNLSSTGGLIYIFGNQSLTSLTGLDSIDAGTISQLYAYNNNSLSVCAVQSICDYLANPGGDIYISYNATGCNSPEEVEAACGVGVDESAVSSQQSAVSIYPNPSSTQITIETANAASKFPGQLSIFNLNGQEIKHSQITGPRTIIDISQLRPGMYFVKLTGDDTSKVVKLVRD